MKHIVFYITMIFCLMNNVNAANFNTRISLFSENLETGSALVVGMSSEGTYYGGFSLSHIQSSTIIQYNNRKNIYPVYVFVGARAPWKLSPYVELGLDLAELIIDELFHDHTDAVNQIDYYFSVGLEMSVTDSISLSVYAKNYTFIFRENISAPIVNSKINSSGVGIKIRF
jgi:hypothetical protein